MVFKCSQKKGTSFLRCSFSGETNIFQNVAPPVQPRVLRPVRGFSWNSWMKFCSMSPHNVLGWSIYSKKKNLRKSIIWLNKLILEYILLIYADRVINMERNTRVSLSIVVIWMANVGLKRLVSEIENWPFLGTKIPQQTWHQRRCVCVCVCAMFDDSSSFKDIIKEPCLVSQSWQACCILTVLFHSNFTKPLNSWIHGVLKLLHVIN